MKESAIFENLEQLAEHLNLKVCNANLRKYSYGIKSGLCKVKGESRVILDKHLHLSGKIDVLVDVLRDFDVDENVGFLDPHVKRLLTKKNRVPIASIF